MRKYMWLLYSSLVLLAALLLGGTAAFNAPVVARVAGPVGGPSLERSALPAPNDGQGQGQADKGLPAGAATPTPTPTPLTCPMTFTDVDLYNPFYVYIYCLYCRGIVSGYPDNTFRPYVEVTRGQVAKIVANSAGFADTIPSTQQTFTDVPPSQPFWIYIERLAARNIINGYTNPTVCTGVGVPCFRPDRSLTRGQLAKIVSNAAGFSDVPGPNTQAFADVPSDNPFWIYIHRLSTRGIIDGYECDTGYINPCTGLLESCDSERRPYYRWCSNVTRGQSAKIVKNTFFPVNCAPAPSPTPGTPSATPVATNTVPVVPTNTPTNTPTGTFIPPTSTPSNTPTNTPTNTAVVPTSTPTVTPTITITPTVTATIPTLPCLPTTFNMGSITTGDPTHLNYVTLGQPASPCNPAPACPGVTTDGLNYHYDTYTYTNPAATAQCVVVLIGAAGCGGGSSGLRSYVYLNSYDPANLCTNYVGGYGAQIPVGNTGVYRLTVGVGQSFTVVVEEYGANAGCASYTVQVTSCTLGTGGH